MRRYATGLAERVVRGQLQFVFFCSLSGCTVTAALILARLAVVALSLGGGGERRAEREGEMEMRREGICAGAGFSWLAVHVRKGRDETY